MLKRSNAIAEKSDDLDFKINLNKAFVKFFDSRNNYSQAYQHQKELMTLTNRKYRKENTNATQRYLVRISNIEKEKKIIQLNADKKIVAATANRNKIIFFLILAGLLSSIYFIIKRIKYRNIKEQEERDKTFRTKMSSDLHDDVGTLLTSLSMQSELLEMKASKELKGSVGKIASMSRDATRRMRDTVWAIDSRKDNVMDLAYRMIDFAEDMLGAKDVEFQLEHNIESKDEKVAAELRQTIFLIFKEAITNATKYGTGEVVMASLQKEKDALKLQIRNDTAQQINTSEASGLGLSNIKKRTDDIGGQLNLTQKNKQFIVNLSFPL